MGFYFWVQKMLRQEHPSPTGRVALAPLTFAGWVYGGIQQARRALYRSRILPSRHPGVPTICVGNVSVGGTGKTPLVTEVCRLLLELGQRPAILTRGYRGNLQGRVAAVSDGETVLLTPKEAGDEPVLLARALPGVPVVAGSDRVACAEKALRDFGATALVMDDGFQHLRLRRDFNLLTVDATRPFGYGKCLPRGTLREPLPAFADAQMIVLTRSDRVGPKRKAWIVEELRRYNADAPILEATHAPDMVVDVEKGTLSTLELLRGAKVVAFAGIGNPEAFFEEVGHLGASVVESVSFPDHHPFQRGDMDKLIHWAELTRADYLLTTEKDAVRLAKFLPLPLPLLAVSIRMDLGEGEALFRERIGALFRDQQV